MIGTPEGWFRQARADWVHLRGPKGRPIGEFRYRENYGPLRPAKQIVAAKLASVQIPGLEIVGQHAPERLTTAEGEHAALVRIDATLLNRPARRVMGIVFGDRFTTLLDGMSIHPTLFDEFEEVARDLTLGTRLELGTRRRRFVYQIPAGWQSIANVFVTTWLPPDYPLNNSRIIVTPATALAQEATSIIGQLINEQRRRGSEIAHVGDPTVVSSDFGLKGQRWHIETHPWQQAPRVHEIAIYADQQYSYALRMELVESAASAGSLEVFNQLCASVEPLLDPVEKNATAQNELFSIWAE